MLELAAPVLVLVLVLEVPLEVESVLAPPLEDSDVVAQVPPTVAELTALLVDPSLAGDVLVDVACVPVEPPSAKIVSGLQASASISGAQCDRRDTINEESTTRCRTGPSGPAMNEAPHPTARRAQPPSTPASGAS